MPKIPSHNQDIDNITEQLSIAVFGLKFAQKWASKINAIHIAFDSDKCCHYYYWYISNPMQIWRKQLLDI